MYTRRKDVEELLQTIMLTIEKKANTKTTLRKNVNSQELKQTRQKYFLGRQLNLIYETCSI